MNEEKCGECVATGNMPIKNEKTLSADTTKLVGIYGLRNKVNGKWYIGQSLDVLMRWHRAYNLLQCKGQPKIYNALLKYRYDGFDKILIEKCVPVDWILDYREAYWMRNYDSIKSGYNLKEAGSHGKHSVESREKMRKSQTGKVMTEESKEKIRKSMIGRSCSQRSIQRLIQYNKTRTFSEETKEKLRKAATGRIDNDGTREKRRASHIGKSHSENAKKKISDRKMKWVCVFDKDGNFLEEIFGIKTAAIKYKISHSMVSAITRKEKKLSSGITFSLRPVQ